MFVPESVALREAGPAEPYEWLMDASLRWTGRFRGATRSLDVPADAAHPFSTDLASVPRSLTWLFPRYGRYTKAAVLHDYLCQHFRDTVATTEDGSDVEQLKDRSDADEVFRLVMGELGVPVLRRWLMWGAVTWATVMTALVPGRRRQRGLCWAGRIVALLAVLIAVVDLVVARDRAAVVLALLLVPAGVLAGGTVALARADRIPVFALGYALTIVFAPLLAIGLVLGLVLYVYFFVEDLFSGFPALRRFMRDLFSHDAKVAKLGTPQFGRLAAVMEG